MTQLVVSKIHITLLVKISHVQLAQHLPSSPEVVGEMLTEAVAEQVKQQKLGYFPALDFFQQQGSIDAELLDAAQAIGWFASRLAREQIQIRMRPFFSSLSFQSVHTQAFSLPAVRPSQLHAWQALKTHYTPDTVKLDIVASVLKKQSNPEGLANWARQLFTRHLEGVFEKLEVIQTVVMKT